MQLHVLIIYTFDFAIECVAYFGCTHDYWSKPEQLKPHINCSRVI